MNSTQSRRVVVTGLGVVTSLGHDMDLVFDNLCQGTTGIKSITRFNTLHCPSKIGGIIEDFDPFDIFSDRASRRLLRNADWIQTMGLCAAELAWQDGGLQDSGIPAERIGVFIGTGRGGSDTIEELVRANFTAIKSIIAEWEDKSMDEIYTQVIKEVADYVNPAQYIQQCPVMVSAYISIRFKARGPILTNVNLCSAGAQAIGEAAWVIIRDDADVMITGGSDSMLNPIELSAFCSLEAVSKCNEDGPEASRPFDLRRDGCVVGEGAIVMILEEMDHARSRDAHIYAELLGYGSSSDAFKVTAPPEDGEGAILAMQQAMRHAYLLPEDIDHVNAHGTSTPLNDRIETDAIKTVLGDHVYKIPVVSTKSMTGHLVGAAGALEAAISVKCIEEKRVPPTTNLKVPDPKCDLDYVTEGFRSIPDLRVVMSNSFAIGGSNGTLIFSRYDEE